MVDRLRLRACLLALAAGLMLSAAGCREKQNNSTTVTEVATVSETTQSTQSETTTESTETTTEEVTEKAVITEERDEKKDPYISPEVIAERFPDDGEYYVEAAGQLYRRVDSIDELNPPGFNYDNTYEDVLPGTYEYTSEGLMDGDYGNVYFVSEYSKRYDTEDVADLMGKLMGGKIIPYYYSGEHMQAKCRQLFYMIRAGYDDSDWPEQTAWEKRIDDAAEGKFGD